MAHIVSHGSFRHPSHSADQSGDHASAKNAGRGRYEYDGHPLWRPDYTWDKPFNSTNPYQPTVFKIIADQPVEKPKVEPKVVPPAPPKKTEVAPKEEASWAEIETTTSNGSSTPRTDPIISVRSLPRPPFTGRRVRERPPEIEKPAPPSPSFSATVNTSPSFDSSLNKRKDVRASGPLKATLLEPSPQVKISESQLSSRATTSHAASEGCNPGAGMAEEDPSAESRTLTAGQLGQGEGDDGLQLAVPPTLDAGSDHDMSHDEGESRNKDVDGLSTSHADGEDDGQWSRANTVTVNSWPTVRDMSEAEAEDATGRHAFARTWSRKIPPNRRALHTVHFTVSEPKDPSGPNSPISGSGQIDFMSFRRGGGGVHKPGPLHNDPMSLASTLKEAAQVVDDFFRDMKSLERLPRANSPTRKFAASNMVRRETPPVSTHRELLARAAADAKVHSVAAGRAFTEPTTPLKCKRRRDKDRADGGVSDGEGDQEALHESWGSSSTWAMSQSGAAAQRWMAGLENARTGARTSDLSSTGPIIGYRDTRGVDPRLELKGQTSNHGLARALSVRTTMTGYGGHDPSSKDVVTIGLSSSPVDRWHTTEGTEGSFGASFASMTSMKNRLTADDGGKAQGTGNVDGAVSSQTGTVDIEDHSKKAASEAGTGQNHTETGAARTLSKKEGKASRRGTKVGTNACSSDQTSHVVGQRSPSISSLPQRLHSTGKAREGGSIDPNVSPHGEAFPSTPVCQPGHAMPWADGNIHSPGFQWFIAGSNRHVPPTSPGVLSPLLLQSHPAHLKLAPSHLRGSPSATGQIVETLKMLQMEETQRLRTEEYIRMRAAVKEAKDRKAANWNAADCQSNTLLTSRTLPLASPQSPSTPPAIYVQKPGHGVRHHVSSPLSRPASTQPLLPAISP